jgi:NADH:ubiquinone oxidoreductase subunit E
MLASAHDVGQLIRDREVVRPISLISFLSETQDRCCYLHRRALVFLSRTLGMSVNHTCSVAILDSAFSLKPRGVPLCAYLGVRSAP